MKQMTFATVKYAEKRLINLIEPHYPRASCDGFFILLASFDFD
ncbi:hypothetical protein ALP22_03984 [Pseudomonas coronafaciens pv. porri]|nr:Uncharacterized protein ALO89_02082 [Pseudomonas coronafaciens pv. porri]RMU81904.1 hypothetical protein ALP22_03984 [Pseudomonas coronafaciens pv. porri]RMW02070.1 hypothetical protein ALO99_02410 [Pseudomonas coronafaciens pv. porri]RMW03001.1 hypothetical protein ALP00_00872 [Pseudomonas coronafaciens pv. porri]